MPMSSTVLREGGETYANPFVGPIDHPDHVKLDVSGLTTAEVDEYGYLKPGVPLTAAGILVAAGFVWGVTIEAVKIVAANPTNVSLAADTSDPLVAVARKGMINRDIAEDNLGRAYTAAELAGFVAAGSQFSLTTT